MIWIGVFLVPRLKLLLMTAYNDSKGSVEYCHRGPLILLHCSTCENRWTFGGTLITYAGNRWGMLGETLHMRKLHYAANKSVPFLPGFSLCRSPFGTLGTASCGDPQGPPAAPPHGERHPRKSKGGPGSIALQAPFSCTA